MKYILDNIYLLIIYFYITNFIFMTTIHTVPCQWKRWSGWSTCSVTCGGGKETRSRGKTPAQYGGAPCVGSGTESRDCNTKPCPGDWYN